MTRALTVEQARTSGAQLAGVIRRMGWAWTEEHVLSGYSRAAQIAAAADLGVKLSGRATLAQIADAMATASAALTCGRDVLPSYRPTAPQGDGHGGTRDRIHCQREGVGGPCWGQTEWFEARDLMRGAHLSARCQGHAGAMYRPPTKETA